MTQLSARYALIDDPSVIASMCEPSGTHVAGDGVPVDGPDAISDVKVAGEVERALLALGADVVHEAVLPLAGDLARLHADAGACSCVHATELSCRSMAITTPMPPQHIRTRLGMQDMHPPVPRNQTQVPHDAVRANCGAFMAMKVMG